MVLKKDFERVFEQHRFKTSTERAKSIQEVSAHDSIVVCQRYVADLFNTIDPEADIDRCTQIRSSNTIHSLNSLAPGCAMAKIDRPGGLAIPR